MASYPKLPASLIWGVFRLLLTNRYLGRFELKAGYGGYIWRVSELDFELQKRVLEAADIKRR